jgi:predicted HAD superfamily Cof-like phosphohydrolase
MRWFGKKVDDTAAVLEEARAASEADAAHTFTIQAGTTVTVSPGGSLNVSGPDADKIMDAVKQATLGPTTPDTDLSKAISEIAKKYQGRAPDDAVPALKVALKAHGHDVPDEWVTLIAQTISKGGTTNLSFGNWSSTAK